LRRSRLSAGTACLAILLNSNSFAAPAVININTQTSTPLAFGFSGFNVPQLRNAVEYYDTKFLKAIVPLKPGIMRFPAGTASMAYDWQAGMLNTTWLNYLIGGTSPLVSSGTANILTASQQLTQVKSGVFLADYAAFASTFGSPTVICFNGYTDNNPSSAALMAQAAQQYGLNVVEWELANEPYLYPNIFATPAAYAGATYSPYFTDLTSVAPSAVVGAFSAGLFPGMPVSTTWDTGLAAYTPRYWNASSIHIYPMSTGAGVMKTWETLNGILAHGSVDYISSYLVPLIGAGTPVFITEFNCCDGPNNPYNSYLYNGVFLVEYIARLSSMANVKGVLVNSLYTDNYDTHGILQSVNDYETYLLAQLAANPSYSTNTATNPNTQFQFYTSAPGVALAVANQAFNRSSRTWPTTVTGSNTVPIVGYDSQPVPALFAQAYLANTGSHYLLITNKASAAQYVTVQLNGVNVTGRLALTFVANSNGQVANTASSPSTVAIQTSKLTSPFAVGPNSVTVVNW